MQQRYILVLCSGDRNILFPGQCRIFRYLEIRRKDKGPMARCSTLGHELGVETFRGILTQACLDTKFATLAQFPTIDVESVIRNNSYDMISLCFPSRDTLLELVQDGLQEWYNLLQKVCVD